MARELDSEILRRLQQQYGEMSDGELLNLAEQPDDLTEVALEVLRGEITHRGLKPEVAEGLDAAEVQARTEARLIVSPELRVMTVAAGG